MELIGIQRARGRDLATGIVLGAGFGLAALFLYLGTTYDSTTGATVTILFGSIFALDPSMLPLVLGLGGARARRSSLVLYRPLLLSSVSPELAAARGIPVRLVGGLYLLAMAVAVALSAVTIGAILSNRAARRPGRHRAAADHAARAARSRSPARSGSARSGSGSCSPTTATTGRRCTTAGRSASSSSRSS